MIRTTITAGLLACTSTVAAAATFDFEWSADFAPTELSKDDCVDDFCGADIDGPLALVAHTIYASAAGTIEIDAEAGDAFDLSDIISSTIMVHGLGFPSFTVSGWSSAAGTISADGLSARFSASGNPFVKDGDPFFGCSQVGCASGIIEIEAPGSIFEYYDFGSAQAALGSMVMTRQDIPPAAVPLPAGAPLLLAGLAALGWTRRKS